MKTDNIMEIKIDDSGRLRIYPRYLEFSLIYRTATEVHWDANGLFLFSPTPREWSYFDWFKHIVGVVKTEYNCELSITDSTKWTDIPESLKLEIVAII